MAVALKRLTRELTDDGVMRLVRKHEAYTKPSVRRRLKSRAARSRARKMARRALQRELREEARGRR